jgi:hypothetical protein
MALLAILDSLWPTVRQLTGALSKSRSIPYTWSLTHAGTLANSRSFTNAGSVRDARSITDTRAIPGARWQRAWPSATIAEKLRGCSANDSARDGATKV